MELILSSPQAYCGRNSLFVGALSVPLVWVFVVFIYPLTKPIAMLLDFALGREISNVLSRQMLLELVTLNVDSEEHAKKSGMTVEDGKVCMHAYTCLHAYGEDGKVCTHRTTCPHHLAQNIT